MRRLAMAAALLLAAVSSEAVVIYNTTNGNIGLTDLITSRFRKADGGNTIAPPAGQQWRIDSVTLFLSYLAGTYAAGDVRLRVQLFDGFNPAASFPTSVFSSPLGSQQLIEPAAHSSANNAIINRGPMALPIPVMLSGTQWGIIVEGFLRDPSNPDNFLPTDRVALAGISHSSAVAVGTSPAGFYSDQNSDSVITANELFNTDSPPISGASAWQAGVRLDATAVPEPVTALAAIIGLAGLAIRRKLVSS